MLLNTKTSLRVTIEIGINTKTSLRVTIEIGNNVTAHFHINQGEGERMVYWEYLLKRMLVLHGRGIKVPTNKKILE